MALLGRTSRSRGWAIGYEGRARGCRARAHHASRQWHSSQDLRAGGQDVVFTNGVFDLLHPGHVRYLQKRARARRRADRRAQRRRVGAAQQGRRTADQSASRSVRKCSRRSSAVDAVVLFDEDTPAEIIRTLQPDVLVKGADWPADQIVGRDTVEARGGRVVRVTVEAGLFDERAGRAKSRARIVRSAGP